MNKQMIGLRNKSPKIDTALFQRRECWVSNCNIRFDDVELTIGCGFKPSYCHFVCLGKTLPWTEDFYQYIICDICGLVPDWLFSVGMLQAL